MIISPLITIVLTSLNLKLKSACASTYTESTGFTQYLNENYFQVFFASLIWSASRTLRVDKVFYRFDSLLYWTITSTSFYNYWVLAQKPWAILTVLLVLIHLKEIS